MLLFNSHLPSVQQVSAERQAALNRLCSGRAAFTSRSTNQRSMDSISSPSAAASGRDKMADAEVEGNRYKVVWSCLLLLEMVMDDVACAAHFQTLATNVVGKVAELFRLFNTRSTQLVLGAGAIHSAARLKSINAKHLSIVTQCIALILSILPHVRAALMAQLPSKQHALLSDLDKIKMDYSDHNEKILRKLVSIIGGIVEHSLAAKIPQSNFDKIASSNLSSAKSIDGSFECTPFIDSIITNTKKMHQVLNVMLPSELLRDVFSQIFAYLDHKVPSLYKDFAAAKVDPNAPNKPRFFMPTTDNGKRRMVEEVEHMTTTLNCLDGVHPWHFTAMKVLQRELDIEEDEPDLQSDAETDEKKETDDVNDSVRFQAETELDPSDPSTSIVKASAPSDTGSTSSDKNNISSLVSSDQTAPNVESPSDDNIDSVDTKENGSPIEVKTDSSHSHEESRSDVKSAVSEDPVDTSADAANGDANHVEDTDAVSAHPERNAEEELTHN